MEQNDSEHNEWEARIDSVWLWEDSATKALPKKGGMNAGVALCQRRSRRPGAQLEREIYVSKKLSSDREGGMEYVRRELETLKICEHPNILRYVDFSYGGAGLHSTPPTLFTEYCALGDLDQFNAEQGGRQRLSFEEGLQVFRQLAQALLYIHHGIYSSEGTLRPAVARLREGDWQTIIHRDIKPGNGQW
jgi:serine/threonine protein kinase